MHGHIEALNQIKTVASMPLFVVFSCVQMAKPKKKILFFFFWIKLKKKDFF
jgi:hypothetical protein